MMRKSPFQILSTGLILGFSSFGYAADSLRHFSEAAEHSVQAIGHVSVGSVKVLSGAAAVPFRISGALGQAAGEIGDALWEESNRPIGGPLEITDEVFTAGPSPADAMQAPLEKQGDHP
jgi:hypothetical protein